MAWTTTTNVATGDTLTATAFNNQVLGNLNALRGDYATSRYTTADITLNSTSWANWPAGPADLVLSAATSDVIEVAIAAVASNEAVTGYLDVVTIVSSTVTNSVATAGAVATSGTGISSWYTVPSAVSAIGGNAFYKLVAGDISSSTVTLRLRYRTSAASNKTIFANTNTPVVFWAVNHGPIEAP